MIMHSEWATTHLRASRRRIAARRMAEAFRMARGARAQVREVIAR